MVLSYFFPTSLATPLILCSFVSLTFWMWIFISKYFSILLLPLHPPPSFPLPPSKCFSADQDSSLSFKTLKCLHFHLSFSLILNFFFSKEYWREWFEYSPIWGRGLKWKNLYILAALLYVRWEDRGYKDKYVFKHRTVYSIYMRVIRLKHKLPQHNLE